MVNSEEFSKRLKIIFDYYDLSASSFAEKIDVGRASISHILSGRNKPSLDFVLKVVSTFEEVELYWLLNGKGNFPKSESPTMEKTNKKENQQTLEFTEDSHDVEQKNQVSAEHQKITSNSKAIHKIVIFYKDGTFEAFENN
ncbi:helix-turn-helix transcriptional regulator [Psychroflexus aestuariivivens]|uniref:helix-turn-helix transcriptional regulator n=1 Tax=Psychroflexus aestuariivivens TaxID=1795040 RepID=UPI000FDB7CA5|nr:helix-turn-helix transcriptional regulator [Psychroflexus aestuariivivens]